MPRKSGAPVARKRSKDPETGTAADAAGRICPGTRVAFGRWSELTRAKHDLRSARSWGVCWKCQRPLGCTRCMTTNELEILCEPCAAWGTFESLQYHGPMLPGNRLRVVATLAEYPEAWRRRYVDETHP